MNAVFAQWPRDENPDGVQIFLPRSWSNPRPDAVLSHNIPTVVSPYYSPYNKYIFHRAILEDEERQETECSCWHILPSHDRRPKDCWYDWPCGCKKILAIVLTARILVECNFALVAETSEIKMDKAYIISQVTHDGKPCLARFTVLPRRLMFPKSKKRKRRSASGRTLSLTDRKHYTMGRYNSLT